MKTSGLFTGIGGYLAEVLVLAFALAGSSESSENPELISTGGGEDVVAMDQKLSAKHEQPEPQSKTQRPARNGAAEKRSGNRSEDSSCYKPREECRIG